jgi:dethiobiotin synthetase
MNQGIYVTGTDTGIGKTVASCALLHALRAGGMRAVGMKPVASGCELVDGELRNADALALQSASDPRPPYADLNPYALPLPLAPELAARDAGITIALEPLRPRMHACARRPTWWWSKASVAGPRRCRPRIDQADLVRALDLPVVLVVGLRLGCLNHAYLTARAIAADGCRLAGLDRDGHRS